MMGDSTKLSTSDDEEDLEALRLAALQSLKKKNAALNDAPLPHSSPHLNSEKPLRYNRAMKNLQNKRGRFFGSHQGRNGKIGQFNNRVRNTNLISIPTIPSEDEKVEEKVSNNSLTLPQDRYCGLENKDEKTGEGTSLGTSKFNRYDNSDKSETESEEEEEASSEDDSPGKLEKSDSLEALMQELDAEIQGKSKVKEEKPAKQEKPKTKKTKKKKRVVSEAVSTSDSDAKIGEQKVGKVESDNNIEVIKHNESEKNNSEHENKEPPVENKPREEPVQIRRRFDDSYRPATKRPRSRSPVNRRGFINRRRQRNFQKFPSQPIPNMQFVPPPAQYPGPIMPFPNPPFNPMFGPPNINMMNQPPPPFFDRPLSPLAINTESLTTATLAPLSPRSAAFVLENKAIIERRKRSPRRSYSRSPSCSPRRSLTPRRSPRRSPPRRSISPRRKSRSPRRLSRSPRRRSLSPRRRSLSPRRRNIGRSTDNSPKHRAPVRERLGLKPNKTEENKEKPKEAEASPKKEEKPLDPILEARKRKFETNEIKMKEGIIRLKPKDEKVKEDMVPTPTPVPAPVPPPVIVPEAKHCPVEEEKPKEPDAFEELENLLNENALLAGDDIELDAKVDDLFSDEDSMSDNEGRFKVKQQLGEKPLVLPFSKLVNGGEIKSEAIPDSLKSGHDRRRRNNRYDKKRTRGRTPDIIKENVKEEDDKKPTLKKNEFQEKPVKNRISLKNDRHVTPMEKRFERKIEIKIKNPSKYERGGKLKFSKESEDKVPEKVKRKVELGNKDEVMEEEDEEEAEPEIIVENDSGDDENSIINEGDLRAQLSKKRAEKLHRIPVDGVSSRLLQNALQGAVFKKTKKKTKEQDITSSDGKLPIHLRLGIANNSDIFADTKTKRKSRKRKNREVLEQV